MKWIGQHIWSFISRFRNDVYLEDIDTGTIASGGNLGLDSDNKIVKATVSSGSGDITSVQIATDDEVNPALVSSGAAAFRMLSEEGSGLTVTNSNTSTITFGMGKAGSGTTGTASFASADFAVSGAGHVTANAATTTARGSASFNTNNFTVSSGAVSAKTASTTVEGMTTLISENDMASNSSTKPPTQSSVKAYIDGHQGSSSIATVGTVGTGVWQGTAINATYLDGQSGTNTGDETLASINALDITEVGTIDSGVWQGTAIATAYIADDAVTFAKAQGVTPNVFGSVIKLIPSDFMANDDGGNQKFGVGYVETAGTGYGMRAANNATELYAFVSIPQGMTATHVDIFDKNDLAVEVFEAQINATTMVSKGSGNANTTIDIDDVASTATNFLAIEVTTTSATNDKVYGGTVTIAAI